MKKLVLKSETIRALTNATLDQVVGGTTEDGVSEASCRCTITCPTAGCQTGYPCIERYPAD